MLILIHGHHLRHLKVPAEAPGGGRLWAYIHKSREDLAFGLESASKGVILKALIQGECV